MPYSELITVIEKQIELFEKYLEVTKQLLSCKIDILEGLTQTRDEIAYDIDVLEQQKNNIYNKDENPQLVKMVVRNEINYDETPQNMVQVFKKGQQMLAIISKIKRLDVQVVDRISQELDRLEQKIKNVNTGNQAFASKYFEGMGIKNETNNMIGKA